MGPEIEIGKAITFTKKIVKQGRSYSIFVPKNLIDKGLIDPDEFYEVTLKMIKMKPEKGEEERDS